jgi:hypothetical protein
LTKYRCRRSKGIRTIPQIAAYAESAAHNYVSRVGRKRCVKALCTLNCDYRVVFGGDAARFLQTLEKKIAELKGRAE